MRRYVKAMCAALAVLMLITLAGCANTAVSANADPLPSWTDGETKSQIIAFVSEAVKEGGDGFIPVEDRIVVSDMDGTLICETGGATGVEYAEIELIRCLIESERQSTNMADAAVRAALLSYDEIMEASRASGEADSPQLDNSTVTNYYYSLVGKAFMGWTAEETNAGLSRQISKPYAQGRAFKDTFYKPMLELYKYLCDNDFTFYVVSGSNRFVIYSLCKDGLSIGGQEFPFWRCLGSEIGFVLDEEHGKVIVGGGVQRYNVNKQKCICISREIGKVPVIALGNSTGDDDMLKWTKENSPYNTLTLIVNHDDAKRESEYHADDMRNLCEGRGYICASMKDDFKSIYG